MAVYGIFLFLFLLTLNMPETKIEKDKDALKLLTIFSKYWVTLKNFELPIAALLMGFGTSFVYLFASLAPFIAIDSMGLNPIEYGCWNLLPVLGVIAGSQLSRYLTHKVSPMKTIVIGVCILVIGILILLLAFLSHHIEPVFLFVPQLIIYIGNGCIYSNAALIATAQLTDKSNASAMMSFLNVSIPTLVVFSLEFIKDYSILLLPLMYVVLLLAVLIFVFILFNYLRLIRSRS